MHFFVSQTDYSAQLYHQNAIVCKKSQYVHIEKEKKKKHRKKC